MNKFESYKDFATKYRITRIPIDDRDNNRYIYRANPVGNRDFTVEEIEEIIRSGDLDSIRRLSRYYYRTNSEYRANIDFLATLFYYDTIVTPIFEEGKGSKTQIIKAFYNACNFVDKLDLKNTLIRLTKAWLINGMYNGILRM